jgi:cobalt-zinc-cadmium efflux system outer membrane protein
MVAAKIAELQLQQASNELDIARAALSAQWGDKRTRFEQVEGDLTKITAIPDYSAIIAMIKHNPDVARWMTELDQRKASLATAEATRIPDLTVTAGVREYWNTGDMALVTGISLPLPLFDRSQGRIQEALQRLAKAHEEQRTAEVNAHSALERAYRSLSIARNEALTLRNELMPVADRAFKAAREGYRQGKFGYLEVLDAQRTFFETQVRYLNALVGYQLSAAELERLIGVSLDEIGTQRAPTS